MPPGGVVNLAQRHHVRAAVRGAGGGLAGAAASHRDIAFCAVRRGRHLGCGRRLAGPPPRPDHVGALLDPVADKALLVTMYVTLAAIQVLPDWLAILVVFRDVVIVGGVLALLRAWAAGRDRAD